MVFQATPHRVIKRALSQQKCRNIKMLKQFKKIKQQLFEHTSRLEEEFFHHT